MSQIWTGCPSAHASWAEAGAHGLSPPALVGPCMAATAPSLGSALLAGG